MAIIPLIPGEDDVGSAHSGCIIPGMPICDSAKEQCVECFCGDDYFECEEHTVDTCRTGPTTAVAPAYVSLGICEWNRDADGETRGCSCDPDADPVNSGCPLGMTCKDKEDFRKVLKIDHFNKCE